MTERFNTNVTVNDVYSALDAHDAMTITIVATDAFVAVSNALPHQTMQGVVLLYDAIMRRVKPLLPQTDAMQHVFDAIRRVEETAAAVRGADGLPPVE